jgi:AAA15 family ATPase/GTPase
VREIEDKNNISLCLVKQRIGEREREREREREHNHVGIMSISVLALMGT